MNKKIGRKVALKALFSAFKWFAENGACSHRVEWLGEYPLLSTRCPRDTLHILRFLCCDRDDAVSDGVVQGSVGFAVPANNRESAKRLIGKQQFVSFTYLDNSSQLQDSDDSALLNQELTIRELFRQRYDPENLLLVRSDNLHTNGYNSIKESITNLIAAEFFISKGYMVLEDAGSGPDVIAFKSTLLNMLRERRFIGKGASMSELAAIRAFGRVGQSQRGYDAKDEIIAVESESVSPRRGIIQLRGGYDSDRFAYLGFFDRRVLAVPFLNQGATDFDILTYDANGIEYRESPSASPARDFWRSKKLSFLDELHSSMRAMLLLNLTFEEIASMVSSGPTTALEVIYEGSRISVEKILDKIESVI
jgi:hypothetical protein